MHDEEREMMKPDEIRRHAEKLRGEEVGMSNYARIVNYEREPGADS